MIERNDRHILKVPSTLSFILIHGGICKETSNVETANRRDRGETSAFLVETETKLQPSCLEKFADDNHTP